MGEAQMAVVSSVVYNNVFTHLIVSATLETVSAAAATFKFGVVEWRCDPLRIGPGVQ